MNTRAMRAIVWRDLRIISKSKGVLIPMIIVPLVMLVLLPGGLALLPSLIPDVDTELEDLGQMLAAMPEALRAELAGYSFGQQWVVLMILYMFAPMYLITPLMVASVIAADSFAGEKERKTLEALLYTPTSDAELYLAKLLSAWVPAVVISWVGFVLYGTVANVAGWPIMGRVFFPNLTWVLLALWVSPAIAGLGLGASVLVSTRVSTFQEAYQSGGAVVLVVIVLLVGQITGVIYFGTGLVIALGFVLWLIDAVLLWIGSRSFERGQLLARL